MSCRCPRHGRHHGRLRSEKARCRKRKKPAGLGHLEDRNRSIDGSIGGNDNRARPFRHRLACKGGAIRLGARHRHKERTMGNLPAIGRDGCDPDVSGRARKQCIDFRKI